MMHSISFCLEAFISHSEGQCLLGEVFLVGIIFFQHFKFIIPFFQTCKFLLRSLFIDLWGYKGQVSFLLLVSKFSLCLSF